MTPLPRRVTIVEVGPRDGLQNENTIVPAAAKIAFINRLVDAGLEDIEVASFVHPKLVPQMADAEEVLRGLPAKEDVTFSALVPNARGLDRAAASGVRRIAVFTAASETFAQRNLGMTIAESIGVFRDVVRRAADLGMSARGYVSTAFACPFEGRMAPGAVRDVALQLLELGVDQVAISDTIGVAAPLEVERLIEFLVASIEVDRLALHLHATHGTAMANVFAGLALGVTTFDASAGGLGGCPFAPGAAGNLPTEDLVYMLDRMGIESGVHLAKVLEAAESVAGVLGRTLESAQARRRRGCGTGTPIS